MMPLARHTENMLLRMVRAKLFDIKLAGFNLNKEVEYLSMIKENPVKPFTLLIGGVKIKDKIGALENLLPKAKQVLVGGVTVHIHS